MKLEVIGDITADDIDDIPWSFTVTCPMCGDGFTGDVEEYADKSFKEQAADVLNDAGWQNVETTEMVGYVCPACIEDGGEGDEDE